MRMIVGLGNPGTKYQYIKHNIGFMVVDQIAREHQAALKKNPFKAGVVEFFHNGEKILLVRPRAFMDESGRIVEPLMTCFGIYPEELTVIYDDLDLAIGETRLRRRGSVGGHNSIKNIIFHLNMNVFDRIKVGIDRPGGKKTVVQHVLSPFSRENQPLIKESIFQSVKVAEYLIEEHSFMDAMNQFS